MICWYQANDAYELMKEELQNSYQMRAVDSFIQIKELAKEIDLLIIDVERLLPSVNDTIPEEQRYQIYVKECMIARKLYGGQILLLVAHEEDRNQRLEEVIEDAFLRHYGNTEVLIKEKDLANYKEALKEKISSKKPIKVCTTLETSENRLTATIIVTPKRAVTYVFELYQDGIKKERRVTSENTSTFLLSDAGIYTVKGIANSLYYNGYAIAPPISYMEGEKESYQSFLREERKPNLLVEPIDYYVQQDAEFDFCLISSKKETTVKLEPLKEHKLPKIGGYYNLLLIAGETMTRGHTTEFLSGYCIANNRLLIGTKDLKQSKNVGQIKDCIGEYTYMSADSTKLNLQTDYFGHCKIYWYQDQDYTICANRYHLILLILKKLGRKLSFDVKKAAALLTSCRTSFLYQAFTSDMTVQPIRMLLAGWHPRLTNSGWHLRITGIAKQQKPVIFHENEYKKLLRVAKKELLLNAEAALSYQSSPLLVDLTGGMDSRLVYATVSQLVKYKDKIRIRANDDQGSKDLPVALLLNSVFKFPYNAEKEQIIETDFYEINQRYQSIFLGSYYSGIQSKMEKSPILLRLSGGGGEVVARPYYSKFMYHTDKEACYDRAKIARPFVYQHGLKIITDASSGAEFIISELEKEFLTYPYQDPLDCLEYHYMTYRSPLHFHRPYNVHYGTREVMILQSKTLYALNHMTRRIFRSDCLERDITTEIAPELAQIPYETEFLKGDDAQDKTILIERKKWEQAAAQKKQQREIIRDAKKRKLSSSAWEEEWYQALCYNFWKLMHLCPELSELVGVELWYFIRTKRDRKQELLYLYNKIASLRNEIRFVKE